MQDRYPKYDPKFGCFHGKTIFDQHTSTIVCLLCGIVLEENLPFRNTLKTEWSFRKKEDTKEEEKKWKKLSHTSHNLSHMYISDLIKDIGEIWHLSKSEVEFIHHNYSILARKLMFNQRLSFKPEEILSYTLHQHCTQHEYCYSIFEICKLLNTTPSKFLSKIQNELQDTNHPYLASFSNKICAQLNFSFKTKQFILALCRKYRASNSSMQPKTYCALIIYWFCTVHVQSVTLKSIVKLNKMNLQHMTKLNRTQLKLKNFILKDCAHYKYA